MMSMVPPSELRRSIVKKVLNNFQRTLPIYADMLEVAQKINAKAGPDQAERLGRIMHAAVRCADANELNTIRRIFALLGCQPVNYYDLRERISVQSTAFRPVTSAEIEKDGFRLFCSMLSIDCIEVRDLSFVQSIIDRRQVFSESLLELIEQGERDGGLHTDPANVFVSDCVDLFTRPEIAMVSLDEHEKLRAINKVAAQVLVTNSLAFNHLTPSVASVPAAHQQMVDRGIQTIPVWQGPVGKDVVLRQTSCLAPPVKLKFPGPNGQFKICDYQETFVEFEERLQALTPSGRQIFERMFAQGKQSLELSEADPGYPKHYYQIMASALAAFPSDSKTLWKEQLAYFTFETDLPKAPTGWTADDFDALVDSGAIRLVAQRYEDFFGPAATNIFNSNIGLDDVSNVGIATKNSKANFESMLGSKVIDMYQYYASIQTNSRQTLIDRWFSHVS